MTPSGRITSPLEVAQHVRATFFTPEWQSQHLNMKINQVVVMSLDVNQILRPVSPPDISPFIGIKSSQSFLLLGTPTHCALRADSCWCNSCSRVRGRGYGTVASSWGSLVVLGCTRSTQTLWKEGKFTVVATGIKQRKERVAKVLAKELSKMKPDKWGCVQASQLCHVHMCIQKKRKRE